MPTKRDRKRHQRVQRERRRERVEERRYQSSRGQAFGKMFSATVESLAAVAAEPQRFAYELATLLADPERGGVFGHVSTAYAGGVSVAKDAGAQTAAALAEHLASVSVEGGGIAAAAGGEPETHARAEATRWWSVGLYSGAGDDERAEQLASETMEARGAAPGDDPEVAWLVGRLRLEAGHPASAAQIALELHKVDYYNPMAEELLGDSLAQLSSNPDGPEGEAVLALFADRSRLYGLRRAIGNFLERDPEVASWAQLARREWEEKFLAGVGADEWDRIAGQHPFASDNKDGAAAQELLAEESTWSRGPEQANQPANEPANEPASGAAGEAGTDDQDNLSLLERFAADPATPPELAELARDWQDRARWGLWQLPDPSSSPGAWVKDLVTRRLIYASVPRDHLAELPRWSVLAGCFFLDRGAWRSASAFAVLDPLEGDRAAEVALTLGTNFIGALAEQRQLKGAKQMRGRTPRLEHVPPHGVAATYAEPMNPELCDLHSKVVCIALPELLGTAWASRQRGPSLVNTDQEPLELFEATARVPDPAGLLASLARKPEFEAETASAEVASQTRFAWLGREMTAMEAENSWAELQAMAAQRGLGPIERPAGERRWIRGSLRLDGDLLTIEVNSRARLERLTALLSKLGVPEPVVERHVDPRLDTALPAGWRPIAEAGSPESEAAWRSRWLDEQLPALGTTPREAANRAETAPQLETLLRLFEWEADLARFAGKRPLDVGLVREALADDEGHPFQL